MASNGGNNAYCRHFGLVDYECILILPSRYKDKPVSQWDKFAGDAGAMGQFPYFVTTYPTGGQLQLTLGKHQSAASPKDRVVSVLTTEDIDEGMIPAHYWTMVLESGDTLYCHNINLLGHANRQFWFVSGGGAAGSTFTENWYGLTFSGTRVSLDWTAGGSETYSTSDQLSLSYGKNGNTTSRTRQWIRAAGYSKYVYSPTATSTAQLAVVTDLPDELENSRNIIGNQTLNTTPQNSTNTNMIAAILYSYTGNAYPNIYPTGTKFYSDGGYWRIYTSSMNQSNTIITDSNMISEFVSHSQSIGSITVNGTSQSAGNAVLASFTVYQVTEYTDTYNFTIRGSANNMYTASRLRIKIQNCNSCMYQIGRAHV